MGKGHSTGISKGRNPIANKVKKKKVTSLGMYNPPVWQNIKWMRSFVDQIWFSYSEVGWGRILFSKQKTIQVSK